MINRNNKQEDKDRRCSISEPNDVKKSRLSNEDGRIRESHKHKARGHASITRGIGVKRLGIFQENK